MSALPEIRKIRLRIGQPRAYHPDGWDRSEEIEVPELMHWLDTVLLPAMERADPRPIEIEEGVPYERTPPLNPGEWCRFCPVKRQCPALNEQFKALEAKTGGPDYPDDNELLGNLYAMLPTVRMKIAAIETEVHARNLRDPTNLVPGTKLVTAIAKRQWKDGAEDALAVLGPDRYTLPVLKSPNQIEETFGAKGKKLARSWASTPDAGYTTVPVSSNRKAVSLQKPVDNYQAYLEQPQS